jgi:hypothetical protein
MEKNFLNLDVLKDMNIPEIKIESDKPDAVEETTTEVVENTGIREVESIAELEGEPSVVEEEEEEEEPEIIENENNEEEDSVKMIAKWQHELGIFDFDEEEYKSSEDKEEYFKNKFIEKARKLGTETLPDVIKELADKYAEGVPLDELIASRSNQQRLENIDDEALKDNVLLQENLVAALLEQQGYDETEIKTKLEKYKDALLLEDEAKTAIKKLMKAEQDYQKQLDTQAIANRKADEDKAKEELANLKKSIQETTSFIDGIELNSEHKEKLYAGITKRDRDGLTEFERKMKDKKIQMAVAQFVLQLDGKVDAIKRTVKSAEAVKLKESVNTTTRKPAEKSTKIDLRIAKDAIGKIKSTNKF